MSINNFGIANFSLVGRKNKALNLNFPGNVLILFKMSQCRSCIALEPQYRNLAGSDRRIQYGIVDLDNPQNRSIVQMSRETKTPISHTPHIVFYSSGRPFAKYTGKYNIGSIQSFIGKVTARVPPPDTQQFSNPQFSQQPQGGMYGAPTQYGGGQPPRQGGLYQPEQLGSAPNMASLSGGGGNDRYSQVNIEDDEEIQMLIPPDITPYTKPWESAYRRDM